MSEFFGGTWESGEITSDKSGSNKVCVGTGSSLRTREADLLIQVLVASLVAR